MGILGNTHPQPAGPPNTSQFPSDSVLGRMARGSSKPTEADLEELLKLAQNGSRAERRAAAKHLKKQGIAAPPATPRAPMVTPVVEPAGPGEPAPAEPAAAKQAQTVKRPAAKKEPAKQAQARKQSAPRKAA